ncbi:MAG: hypothetical protein ACXVKA_14970, partial [Acidimicrobiia bacterium]
MTRRHTQTNGHAFHVKKFRAGWRAVDNGLRVAAVSHLVSVHEGSMRIAVRRARQQHTQTRRSLREQQDRLTL